MTASYRFASFELRCTERALLRHGQVQALGARGLDVLLALVEGGGALVTKEALLQRAWPGLVVEEANVHVQISQLRKLLGSNAIATSATLGYRFALPVQAIDDALPRHNLPAERTVFVGRAAALDEAQARLASTRLLTLIGIGGTGKTRLALKLAERLLPGHADGVWWIDLAPLDGADQLAPAVAEALGCKLHIANAAADALAAFLRERAMLLVLDNGEHLLDAVAALADRLLAAAPALQLLVTSREALGVQGEAVLPVRPLQLPAPQTSPAQIAQAEAVRLFAQRAVEAVPGFTLDDAGATVVAEICRRVDGIPLALELAAAQLRVLAPVELLQMLDERFRLLAGHRRALPRQQTLHAVIQWSHDRLPEHEQQLLGALAVCSGGCDLDALAALMPPASSRAELAAGLTRLAEQSLLAVREGSPAGGAPSRYNLLETVRQFALDRLQASGRAAELRDSHAQHYLALAQAHDQEVMLRGEGAASLARLDPERDNLLQALAWYERSDDAQAAITGLRFAVALRHYWTARAMLAVGLNAIGTALTRAAALPTEPCHYEALSSLAHMHGILRQHAQAFEHAHACHALAQRNGDRLWLTIARGQMGFHALSLGRLDDAQADLSASLQQAEALQETKHIGHALNGLAGLAMLRDRPDEAAPLLDRLLALRREAGHGYHLGVTLLNTVSNALALGDTARARALAGEAASLMPRVGSRYLSQYLVDRVAALMVRCSAWESAVGLLAASSAQRLEAALPLSADDVAEQQRDLAAARTALGDAAFEATWAAAAQQDHGATLDQVSRWLESAPTA